MLGTGVLGSASQQHVHVNVTASTPLLFSVRSSTPLSSVTYLSSIIILFFSFSSSLALFFPTILRKRKNTREEKRTKKKTRRVGREYSSTSLIFLVFIL